MLKGINLSKILFLDIETVSSAPSYSDLSDGFKSIWDHKANTLLKRSGTEITEKSISDLYFERAGIFSEFGKIICISVGIISINADDKSQETRIKSFADDDEKKVLADFAEMLTQYYNNPGQEYLCGHNIREFDIPYICRRMLIHGIELPFILNIAGRKPWEVKYILDTLELWKFGDYKNYTSLKTLTTIFDVPSPKGDIDGSEVNGVYWNDNDLPRIQSYCERDVLAVIHLLLRFKNLPLIPEEKVMFL